MSESASKVQFSKATSNGVLPGYYLINESGFDRNPPAAAINQGIEIIREFLDMKGNVITQVKVGEEFLVRLRLRSTNKDMVQQVAVVDLLPGGVEPVLELQPAADSSIGVDPAAAPNRQTGAAALPIGLPDKSNWNPEHVDVRDDRIVLYGDVCAESVDVCLSNPCHQCRNLSGAAGICRRHVQPKDHRTRTGGQAGNRKTVTAGTAEALGARAGSHLLVVVRNGSVTLLPKPKDYAKAIRGLPKAYPGEYVARERGSW